MSNTQDLSPQGYNINEQPYNTNPFWENGEGSGSVSVQVGTVTTQTTAAGTQASVGIQNVGTEQDAVLNFNFSIPRGNTGDKGDRGSSGSDGADGVGVASVEQTVTSSADGGDNVITITLTNGHSYNFIIKNGSKGSTGQQGETGPRGLRGETGGDGRGIQSILQTTTSTADDGNNIITCILTDGTVQTFTIQNGSKGADGVPGQNGKTYTIVAQGDISRTGGNPSIDIDETVDEENSEIMLDFHFDNIQGENGNDGVTPVITATASVDSYVGTPSVDVYKTGTDAAPVFEFIFHNLKGEPGESGGGGSSSYYETKDTMSSIFSTSNTEVDFSYGLYTPVSGDYVILSIFDVDAQELVDSITVPILCGEYSGLISGAEGTHNIIKDINGSLNFVTVTYEPRNYYFHVNLKFVGNDWTNYTGQGYSITCNLIGKE